MFKGETIHGYKILEDFKVAGGTSKVTFAEQGGKEFFIKEFLSPKYPTADSHGSEKVKAQKLKACEEFEKHHKELNARISSKVGKGGNLVAAVDFFREGPCYYKVTEKVDVSSLTCKEISCLSKDKLLLICKSVCHSVKILHDLNIVHGDLKPDNILIKKTSAGYSGKLIDFDDGYFTGNPPKQECLVGTPEYYSPEQAVYIMNEDEEISGSTLTLKSDIFTLGIIFCEYLTGKKPLFDTKYSSTWSCIADGGKVNFSGSLSNGFEDVLRKMLSLNSKNRPSIGEVFEFFKGVKDDGKTTIITLPLPTPVSLRGSGLRIAEKEKINIEKTDFSHSPKPSSSSSKLHNYYYNMKQISEITIEVTPAGYDNIAQILNLLNIKYKAYSGLFDCDILFINCAETYNIDKLELKTFVKKGGIVYASDWASRVISKAFPDIMKFDMSNDDIGIVRAKVVDFDLRQHMGNYVDVNFDLPGWYVISKVMSDEVLLEDDKTHQPLMVKCHIGEGYLYYTSFHNHGLTTENEEKLLQLLILKQIGELNSQNIQQTANYNGINLMNLRYKSLSPKIVEETLKEDKKKIITEKTSSKTAISKNLRGKGLSNTVINTEVPKLRISKNLNHDE